MLSIILLVVVVLLSSSPRSSVSAQSSSSSLLSFPSWSSLFPSHSHRFTSEKLLDLDSLGLPKTGLIAGFGSFINSPHHLNLIYLSYDQRSLSIWEWDRKNYSWKEDPSSLIKTKSDFIVTNVLPGDFNRDGKLDLILMGEQHPSYHHDGKQGETKMLLYLQSFNHSFTDSIPIELDSASLPQPIPFDAQGLMTTSLLGLSPSTPTSTRNPDLQIWLNSNNKEEEENNSPPFETISSSTATATTDEYFDFSSHPTGDWNCKFSVPHFNQFLDLDGDCLADLFFTCQDDKDDDEQLRYEIWINEKNIVESGGDQGDDDGDQGKGKFVWKRGGDLPKGTKSVNFADMDRDGTLDMILTVCPNQHNNRDCFIQIVYNDQIPLCSSTSTIEEDCRDIENLCVGDSNFNFNFNLTDSGDRILIPLQHDLITSSQSFRGILPNPPQIGDFNIDGYPDLLILVSPRDHPSQRLVKLLQSKPCASGSGSVGKCSRRRYEVVQDGGGDSSSGGGGIQELYKFKDVEQVNWFDLDDDGSLDIVVQRTGQSGAARRIHFLKNNWFNDAFFLKATVLNGACKNWCTPPPQYQHEGQRFKPYGSSYSGASYKFTVLDPTGQRRSTQYAQLPTTSYLSLGLPYAHLGLGRTNNYVENLFIGTTRSKQLKHFINLEGVIPNSQVLILPHQDKEGLEGDVGDWKKELYLKPGDWIPWVTIVLFSAIIGLGIVVFVLSLNEKREDEIERRARLLSLNFGAL